MNLIAIGLIGMVCFSISGIPQMTRSIRDGHSEGMALLTIWLWLIGEFCYIAYTLANYSSDFVLLVNYIMNFSVVAVIAYYKHFPRKSALRQLFPDLLPEQAIVSAIIFGKWFIPELVRIPIPIHVLKAP